MKVLAVLVVLASTALYIQAQNVICGTGTTSKTVTLEDGNSYIFKTQRGKKYKGNTKCTADFNMGNTCAKMSFSCTKFNTNNKDKRKCAKGDTVTVIANGKSKVYCKNKKQKVTSRGDMKVVFTSNAKKHSSGAVCMVKCTEAHMTPTQGPMTPTTTTKTTTSSTALVEIRSKEVTSTQMWNDKGTGASQDFSCWNPVPPLSYVMIGSIPQGNYDPPPSAYVVMATDGIFQYPVGYRQIWTDAGSGGHQDGSFWEPLCTLGYRAAGHYCQKGYNKPSNDAMVCVKNTMLMECGYTKVWADHGSGAHSDVSVFFTEGGYMIAVGSYNNPKLVFCLKD